MNNRLYKSHVVPALRNTPEYSSSFLRGFHKYIITQNWSGPVTVQVTVPVAFLVEI